jgi:TonB-linked SusC/RagA family outer membrane protein
MPNQIINLNQIRMKRRITHIFFISCLLFIPFLTNAQGISVTGKVTASDGNPLPGVSVKIQGTQKGVSTNATGGFLITVPGNNSVLIFSQIGMKTKTFTVTGGGPIQIVLEEEDNKLNEVVVVGYGTQKRTLVTGAISSIKAEELKTVSSSRIDQALQGRTAGVTVSPNSGAPGSALSIRVRGTGSNKSSEPLYIVDGVRAGGIEYLDPSEVSSLEILKDAASAAIYGAEGANGVVIITTKSGKPNTMDVNYTFQLGQQSARNFTKMMNAPEYQQYMKEAGQNAPTDAEVAAVGAGTDWTKEVLKNAPQQHHTLNFSGGNEKSTYLLGATYFTQQGIVGGDKAKFDRYTFRINSDHKMKSWLKVGERLSYSNFTSRGIPENTEYGSVIGSMMALDPITPVTYTGALPAHVQNAINAGNPLVKDANGNYYGISRFIQGEYGNPLAQIETTHTQTTQNKVVGNMFADVTPLEGLTFTTRFGIDAAFVRNHAWNPKTWYSSEKLNNITNGSDYQNNYFNWQWENFVTYSKRINEHNFSLMAGTSALKKMYNNLGGSYSGIFKDQDKWAYPDFVQDTPDKLAKIYGQYNNSTLVSYYGRLNYDYKDRYLISATIRRDGSSLFADGHKWGTYPSVSAGWILSKEDFFAENVSNVINYAKLRASWGQNGSLSNVAIGEYLNSISQDSKYTDANGNFILGASPTNLPNFDLTWEKSEQLDFGADLNFMNNRFTLSVDWYKKTTKDLLTFGANPYFVGNVLNTVNSGDVENKGWEFEFSYNNGNDHAFKYEIGANLSTYKNKVTRTNPLYPVIDGAGVGTGWTATRFEAGLPIWYFRGYKTDGIFQNQAQIDQYIAQNKLTGYKPKPGDPVILDTNKDGQISDIDQTYIGDAVPDFTYGLRLNFSYKGFDFLTFIQGSKGNQVLMGFVRNDRRTSNKPEFFYTDRWTGDGSTNSFFSANADAKAYNSDKMVFDGSFARIRQLQLGYTLPNSIASKLKIKNARIYVSLDDFFTFTKYKGLDPEGGNAGGNSLGIDRGTYPTARKALAGISFTF